MQRADMIMQHHMGQTRIYLTSPLPNSTSRSASYNFVSSASRLQHSAAHLRTGKTGSLLLSAVQAQGAAIIVAAAPLTRIEVAADSVDQSV